MATKTNFIDRQVGLRVGELREIAGVSRQEAALLIKCSLEEYKLLEVGSLRFKASQLMALSTRLGVSGAAFFTDLEFPEPQGYRRSTVVPIFSGLH